MPETIVSTPSYPANYDQDAAGFSGSQQIPVAPNNQYMPSAQSSTTKDQGWLQDNLFAQTASTRKRKSPNDADAGESVVKHRRVDDAAGFSGLQQSSVAPNDQYMPSAQSSTTKAQGWLQDNLFAQTASTRKRKSPNDADAGESAVKHRRMDDAAGFSGSQQSSVAPNNQYMPSTQSATTQAQGWLQPSQNMSAFLPAQGEPSKSRFTDTGADVTEKSQSEVEILRSTNDNPTNLALRPLVAPSLSKAEVVAAARQKSKGNSAVMPALRPLVAPSLSKAEVVVTAKQKSKDNSAKAAALRPLVARGLSGAEVVAARQKSKGNSSKIAALRPLVASRPSRPAVVADTRQRFKYSSAATPNTGAGVTKESQSEVEILKFTNYYPGDFARSLPVARSLSGAEIAAHIQQISQNSSAVMPARKPCVAPSSSKAEVVAHIQQRSQNSSAVMPALTLRLPGIDEMEVTARPKPKYSSAEIAKLALCLNLPGTAEVAKYIKEPKNSSAKISTRSSPVASRPSRAAVEANARRKSKGNSAKAAASRPDAPGLSVLPMVMHTEQNFQPFSTRPGTIGSKIYYELSFNSSLPLKEWDLDRIETFYRHEPESKYFCKQIILLHKLFTYKYICSIDNKTPMYYLLEYMELSEKEATELHKKTELEILLHYTKLTALLFQTSKKKQKKELEPAEFLQFVNREKR